MLPLLTMLLLDVGLNAAEGAAAPAETESAVQGVSLQPCHGVWLTEGFG